MQHCKQHSQSILLKANGNTPWITEIACVHKRLNFNQQRTSAFPDDNDYSAGRWRIGTFQEDSRWIEHFFQPRISHGEHTELVDRAKPVLLTTKSPVPGVLLPFQKDRAINHMLQNFWPCQTPVLCHMANKNQYSP